MRFLQVIGTLDPAYGGPQEALRQLTCALLDLGHQSETVTLDEGGISWLIDFPGVVYPLGPSILKYRYNKRLVPWLCEHAEEYDAVIVHGVWQYQSFATWMSANKIACRYFVYIHGALDPWFKRNYPLKHIKKSIYWRIVEKRVLRRALAVLYTCEEERLLVRQSFSTSGFTEKVVSLGIKVPPSFSKIQTNTFFNAYPSLRGKRIFLFLSRIHAKKGCDLLIQAFSKISDVNQDFHLVMAGPDQDGWQKSLEKLAESLNISHRVTWTGMLTGELKWAAYHASEAFVLASHSENFGIVVAEALACGLPVLITDKVNIWKEIQLEGAGLVASDTLEGTVYLLQQWLILSERERSDLSERATQCFHKYFEIHQAAKNLVSATRSPINSVSGE